MSRKEQIIHLWAIGMTYREIGKKLHISHQRVHQILMNYKSFAARDYSAKQFNLDRNKCKVEACRGKGEHIHHIDKDSNNNDKSNLLPLCSHHHYQLHTLY